MDVWLFDTMPNVTMDAGTRSDQMKFARGSSEKKITKKEKEK